MSIARFTEDLRRERLVVLEGFPLYRHQLAEAMAQQLGYQVNLGAVGAQYIGETEKNLSRLFTEANNAGTILFFDEADSLFGKRAEVKDSHDRYANLETRLASFQGSVVLGVDHASTVPTTLLQKAKVVSVNDYWPPR